jgi:3-oxoadipate enol-lactonase
MKRASVIIFFLIIAAVNLLAQKFDNKTNVVTSGYINVDGGKLYYEAAGTGENIVLLHDGMIHSEIWENQFPILAKSYRVIRYDRRGYGKSPASEAAFSQIEDLNQLFIQLKIDKATIFGMSAGGGLTIDFTLKYPEKVNAIVLVGAVVSGYGYSNHMATRGGHINPSSGIFSDSAKLIQYFGWEDPYEVYPGNKKAKERCFELLKANPQNVSLSKHKFEKAPDRAAVKHLSEIKVPTLVLVGEYDIPDVHAHSGVIEAGIPNAKREIIPNAAHLIPLEQPEAFNAVIFNFLNSSEFLITLNSKGVAAAVQYFHDKRKTDPSLVMFHEMEMNSMAYSFLQSGKVKEAIELFKLNTVAFPKSGNVFDSLGEAYLTDGQKDLAVKNYEKSLKLDPGNINAKQVLQKIKESK